MKMYLAWGVIVLTIVLMLILISLTDVLKDTSTIGVRKPYSLARTQAVLWTTIIFCCFIFIWGKSDFIIQVEFGKTALVLLGISLGTTMVGKAIDKADQKNLKDGIINNIHQNDPSNGFWWDILTDKEGISIARIQNVLFSVALMVGFVIYVAEKCKMPVYDDTLLILSGVSSAGYLGVKSNENK
jgi:hypothetical protein